jgi:hypothetical protein
MARTIACAVQKDCLAVPGRSAIENPLTGKVVDLAGSLLAEDCVHVNLSPEMEEQRFEAQDATVPSKALQVLHRADKNWPKFN